ncbi:MAG: PepSY-associated TM helix domain-containing protein [Pseudomonadota bacterium]
MSFLTQAKTKRIVAVHGWSGVVLGLLLYVCIFTGSIVVFQEEIDTWSQGVLTHNEGVGPRVDHHFRTAAREVDEKYYEEITIFGTPDGNVRYLFRTHVTGENGGIEDDVVQLTVNPETGEVVDRWEGEITERERNPKAALGDFWVDLHVQLYMPRPWGLIVTGILGLAMMAAAVTGILLHKHLIRDAFVAARDRARLVGSRDLHVLAGTWGLPFAIVLAFTGAFFSFAISLGLPVMAMLAFGGDQAALMEAFLGASKDLDLSPAPLASLDYIIADAVARTDSYVQAIEIKNYNSVSAEVSVRLAAAAGSLSQFTLGYDGVTRAFLGESPGFGSAPSLSDDLVSIIGPLHFGNFAGFASKTVWLGLGLAVAYVTATGMLLWTKRREEVPLWQRFRQVIIITIWGLPVAMLVSAVFYFVTLPAGDPEWWTPAGFLAGVAIALLVGADRELAERRLRLCFALLCVSLPILRHLTGGASWSEALVAGQISVLAIDILLLVGGFILLKQMRSGRSNEPGMFVQEPAE